MEERVERQASALRRFLGARGDQLRRFIVDCAVELSTKTPIYAMLIGAQTQRYTIQEVWSGVARLIRDF